MRFLLDEGMPVQLLEVLRLNVPHEFEHVDEVRWKGKRDAFLINDAAARRFDGIVTLDVDQLSDPELCRALARSRLHHISLRQGRRAVGKRGVARVIASIAAGMPYVIEDLEASDGQRVVEIALLSPTARHETLDPKRERQRLPYWP